MGVHEGRGQISKALKELLARWHDTRSQWDDAAAEAFEARHVVPLEAASRNAVSAMDQIAVQLQQAKRDCE